MEEAIKLLQKTKAHIEQNATSSDDIKLVMEIAMFLTEVEVCKLQKQN